MLMLILLRLMLMLMQAFETYCTKQAASSMLLASMEREKELLRVFLKVTFTISILKLHNVQIVQYLLLLIEQAGTSCFRSRCLRWRTRSFAG